MANVANNIAPTAIVDLFGGYPPGRAADESWLPRARIRFEDVFAIAAKSTPSDTASINVTCTLPIGFGYVLESASITTRFSTASEDAANYQNVGWWALDFGLASTNPSALGSMYSRGSTRDNNNAGSIKSWQPLNMYRIPFFNRNSESSTFEVHVYDTDTSDATETGAGIFQASLLQYTIPQLTHINVNAPMPTIVR